VTDPGEELTNPAVIAVIQTTQSDHERRLATVETALAKDREISDAKFVTISSRIDEMVTRISDKIDDKVAELYRWVDSKNMSVLALLETRAQQQASAQRWVTGLTVTAIITGLCTLCAVVGAWVTRGAH
jgi:DNA polymerase III delta prime subunit